jgi:outer membrane lipoprotein-sorting protein
MRKPAALAVLLLLLAAPARAYDIADLERDMRAHIEKVMKELGDVTLRKVATFEGARSGPAGMTATTYVKGRLWRSEAKMKGSDKSPDVEVTTLYDGTDVWSVTMGMKHRMPAGAVGQTGPSGLWNEMPQNAKLIGEEEVDGRAAWKVQYEAPEGAPRSGSGTTLVWLDRQSYVPIRMETESFGKPVRMVMSDFRRVKGFEVPHLTEMFSGDAKSMTLEVVSIETGQKLSADLFDAAKLAGGEAPDVSDMMKKALEMQKQMEQSKGGK